MSLQIPVIETERLRLRGPQLGDYDALYEYYQQPRSKWNGGPLEARQVEQMIFACAGQWALRGYGLWFITLKEADTFIGFAGIFEPHSWPEPELGYGIAAAHEGKGIAFEAAQAARQAAATLGLNRLVSFIAHENTRSQALATRLGATHEGDVTLRGTPCMAWRHPEGAA